MKTKYVEKMNFKQQLDGNNAAYHKCSKILDNID